jgi:hypothetical protein
MILHKTLKMEAVKQPFLDDDPEIGRLDLGRAYGIIRATRNLQKIQAEKLHDQAKNKLISLMYESLKLVHQGKTSQWLVVLPPRDSIHYATDAVDIIREEADRHKNDEYMIKVKTSGNCVELEIVKRVYVERRKCEDNAIFVFCLIPLFLLIITFLCSNVMFTAIMVVARMLADYFK